nr:TPA: Galactosyltransferase, related [Neospora caninum Liverpool]
MGPYLADCLFLPWRPKMKLTRFRDAHAPKLCLLVSLLLSALFLIYGRCKASNGDSVPQPATLKRMAEPLPFVQKKTLFLIANEPVLESHVVSNLLHQLLYTLQVPNSHVQLLDEILLSEHGKTNHATLLPWLLNVHRELPSDIEFVWLGTAYSRVAASYLEKLMARLTSEAQNTGDASTSRQWYPHGLCVGHALKDQVLSITHHFYRDDAFVYPFLDAGLLMDRRFLRFLEQTVKEEGAQLPPRIEIDPVHELFKFLYQTRGFLMQHSNLFCPSSPIPRDFDRTEVLYPPRHKRPSKVASQAHTQGNDHGSDSGGEYKGGTAKGMAGSRQSPALSAAEQRDIQGCVSFAVGCRHSPILSHQFFDRMLAYEHDMIERKEALAEQYPIGADAGEDSEFREKEAALMSERPFFIVEPEDVLIAVKTHPRNHKTRVPLLKQLWAEPDVVVEMAQRRAKASAHAHPFHAAVAEQERASLDKHMRNIAIEFFSEKTDDGAPDITNVIPVQVSFPGEKRALCEKMRGIFKHFYENHKTRKYLAIVDDDTLVNVRHLLDAISMTLHPPVPARVFFRQALSDQNAIRKAHAPYKELANSIDTFLADWRSKRGLQRPSESERQGNHESPAHQEEANQQGSGTKKQDKLGPEDAVATFVESFVSKVYVKNRAADEASSDGRKKYADMVDRISPLYLGRRYSFGHMQSGDRRTGGYDYITMGGGVVLDREAVGEILECKTCRCPQDGTADDMILGRWMHQLKIPALHGRWFHQERPADYHPEHVRMTTPVSFHRLEKDTATTKKVFNKFVDVGDGLNVGAEEVDDFEAVDWIDFDWQQVEDAVWHDHDEGDGDLDDGEDEELSLHSIVQRVVEEGKKRGKQNMTPDDIADHLEKEVKEHEEKERVHNEDWSWLHDEL